MESNQPLDSNISTEELYFSASNRSNLLETSTWAKFIAIVGFVFIGLAALGIISMGFFMSSFADGEETLVFGGVLVFYLILIGIYLFPILYLYRFADKVKLAVKHNNQALMDTAFGNLKAHYKFIGILTAIIIGLYFIGIAMMAIVGGSAFLMN